MNFEILIPIWGERYIARFAELGLRSLLAPHNLPWLSRRHRVKFTILTTFASRQFVEDQAAFQRLANITEMAFVPIDDLVSTYGSKYSTILTRAYNRAMAFNRNMLETNFIYLVGDLIFSDGALMTIASVMQEGMDACLMCSPRVDATTLEPILRQMGGPCELNLTSRQMAAYLMEFRHPTLDAKIVRNDEIKLSIAHQFFWQPEPDVMISRCLLLHMFCIRPTRRPADIAAPCDFAFITELAPNGRYHFLTDSDEFLSLEVQETNHEVRFITTYPLSLKDVAEGASSWATSLHHQFLEAAFIFKSGRNEYSCAAGAALTQSYVNQLMFHMSPPVNHQYHFFWLGAVGAHILSEPQEASALQAARDETPVALQRLIERHQNNFKQERFEYGIVVAHGPGPIDTILACSARLAVRTSPGTFFHAADDIMGTGESILIVLYGKLQDFLDLFTDEAKISRVLQAAGEGRAVLLCYTIEPDGLREGKPSRVHLYELYTAQLTKCARLGLKTKIHDLSSSVFDGNHGFIVEIVPDPMFHPPVAQLFSEEYDPLFGHRE